MKRFAIIYALLAVLVYSFSSTYPENYYYPVGAKAVVSLIELLDFLSNKANDYGFHRWNMLRLPVPAFAFVSDIDTKNTEFAGVPTTLFYPQGFFDDGELKPAVVFYHGGGWSAGNANIYSSWLYVIAKKMNTLVVAPDYRLAPEFPFPVPFEDCLNVANEFIARSAEFSVDINRIALIGDSAGGNLATAVGIEIGDKIKTVGLVYPLIQCSNLTLPSYRQNQKQPLLALRTVADAWLSYMGLHDYPNLQNGLLNALQNEEDYKDDFSSFIPEKFKKREFLPVPTFTQHEHSYIKQHKKKIFQLCNNRKIAPLASSDEDIRRLPPTHVITCELDPLRDDGIILVHRMKKLNKRVTWQHLEFGYHGFASTSILFPDDLSTHAMDNFYSQMTENLK